MICLDTTIIIDFLKGNKTAIEKIRNLKEIDTLVTTEVSEFEVFFGIHIRENINERERQYASEFFSNTPVLSFERSCGEQSAVLMTSLLKKGIHIGQNDIFIIATMLHHGCTKIATRNIKHFSQIKGIEVIEY